ESGSAQAKRLNPLGGMNQPREGRKRLARANAGKRKALERTLAQADREVGRLVDGFQRGIISDEEACKRLPEARQRRDAANADLAAAAPAPKEVEGHPAAATPHPRARDDGAASRPT